MADEKKKSLTDLYPNDGALLKRVHQYLINANSNQARTLIEDYIIAKREKRANRESEKIANKDAKEEKKKPTITREIAIQIVTSIDQNYDQGVIKTMEDLRERSKDPHDVREVADYDRAMKKRKELIEKFNI